MKVHLYWNKSEVEQIIRAAVIEEIPNAKRHDVFITFNDDQSVSIEVEIPTIEQVKPDLQLNPGAFDDND